MNKNDNNIPKVFSASQFGNSEKKETLHFVFSPIFFESKQITFTSKWVMGSFFFSTVRHKNEFSCKYIQHTEQNGMKIVRAINSSVSSCYYVTLILDLLIPRYFRFQNFAKADHNFQIIFNQKTNNVLIWEGLQTFT